MNHKLPSNERQVQEVIFGNFKLEPWYSSYHPGAIIGPSPVERLYVCDFCFKYTPNGGQYHSHVSNCQKTSQIPGHLVRENGSGLQLHEINGEDEPLFCQNLSLFAKFFLEQKSVCFAPQPFMYYVLTHRPSTQSATRTVVGFFSKEKLSWDNNILACLLVFPSHQRKGFGQKLMKWSYELAKDEGRLGGPERPLSTLGKLSYHSYWTKEICRVILDAPAKRPLTIKDISEETYIRREDVVNTLLRLGILGTSRKDQSITVNKDIVKERISRVDAQR